MRALPPIDADTLAAQVMAEVDRLCVHTEVPGTVTRTYLSPAVLALMADLRADAERDGLIVTTDAVGNLRVRLEGPRPQTVYLGSHLDTVPDGGRYDGLLGVLMGRALQREAQRAGSLPCSLEVLAFSEEEGVRYGVSFIGSLATVGEVAPLLDRTDAQGLSVRQAIAGAGLDLAQLDAARLPPGGLGYLEYHIEQGPVLEAAGQAAAVVSAVVGQERHTVTFTGRANHAGTTPMPLRQDALAGAAEFVLAAESHARQTPGLAATVGIIGAAPGASNVIPGEAALSLDLRHPDDQARQAARTELTRQAEAIARRRGLSVRLSLVSQIAAVPMDPGLRARLRAAARAEGLDAPELVSGAGHDAMVMARIMPAAMVFLRTPGGLSHHPGESVSVADVAAGLRLGWRFLHGLHEDLA